MKTTYIKTACLLIFALVVRQEVKAQISPVGALYFQNQYLGNPAFAGTDKGLDLNLGIRKQWSNIPGSPAVQTVTAGYALTDKAGLGLNFYNDKSGLYKRTRAVLSYAYHMPVGGDNQNLSFGLSLGMMNERISNEDVRGDQNDQNVAMYNQRDNYIDGDFGIAYSSNGFNIQGALPNMKSFFKKDVIEDAIGRSTFFSAVSYKLELSSGTQGFGLEPKVAYRGVKGFDNVVDAGANLSYAGRVNVFGMYHSTKSTTFGVGLTYENLGFGGMYSTATSALSNYANGNFEVNLKVNLFNKK